MRSYPGLDNDQPSYAMARKPLPSKGRCKCLICGLGYRTLKERDACCAGLTVGVNTVKCPQKQKAHRGVETTDGD